jgi:hypothetical protein
MAIKPVSYADFDVPPPDLMQAVDDGLERHNLGYGSLAEIRGYPNEIAKYLMHKDVPPRLDA